MSLKSSNKGLEVVKDRTREKNQELAHMLTDAYTIVSLVKECLQTEKELDRNLIREISIQLKFEKEQLFMLLEIH
ncbi:hypothetical protein [Pseudoflavonifractor phocaeensis]|uniref:hypothetical protein n=1 Tax=Pseudoflavonifractor phocaeensis TaxID=1870988 RepID=UPI00195B90B7|nr:hypothetical protein [Pseudoflavonifractor phocaeensis]MBM6722241.1 hypothetical protein [Pseudoflavonifractor phocaeensis]